MGIITALKPKKIAPVFVDGNARRLPPRGDGVLAQLALTA